MALLFSSFGSTQRSECGRETLVRAQVRSPTRAHQAHARRLATSALGRKDRLDGSWANQNDARAPSKVHKLRDKGPT